MHIVQSHFVTLGLAVALASCASIDTIGTSMMRPDDIAQAKLVYVPDGMLFRSRLTESRLARSGCTYASVKQADLRKLREVLAHSAVHAGTSGTSMLEPRYALYLERTNGAMSTLLFDRQYLPSQQRDGSLDGTPVVVDASLAARLVQWAHERHMTQSNKACF